MAKRKQATAKRRPWKRVIASDQMRSTDLEQALILEGHHVALTDGVVRIQIAGPEADVELLVDRFLRELP